MPLEIPLTLTLSPREREQLSKGWKNSKDAGFVGACNKFAQVMGQQFAESRTTCPPLPSGEGRGEGNSAGARDSRLLSRKGRASELSGTAQCDHSEAWRLGCPKRCSVRLDLARFTLKSEGFGSLVCNRTISAAAEEAFGQAVAVERADRIGDAGEGLLNFLLVFGRNVGAK